MFTLKKPLNSGMGMSIVAAKVRTIIIIITKPLFVVLSLLFSVINCFNKTILKPLQSVVLPVYLIYSPLFRNREQAKVTLGFISSLLSREDQLQW